MFKRGRRKKEKSFVVTTVREILVTSDLEPLPSFSSQADFYKTAYLIRRNKIDLMSRHYASNMLPTIVDIYMKFSSPTSCILLWYPFSLEHWKSLPIFLPWKKYFTTLQGHTNPPTPPPPSPETTFSYCLYLRNKSCNLGARLPKVTFRYQCFKLNLKERSRGLVQNRTYVVII